MKWVMLDSSVEASGGVIPLILFLGFRWGRVVSGAYQQGKGKFYILQIEFWSSQPISNPAFYSQSTIYCIDSTHFDSHCHPEIIKLKKKVNYT